MCCLSRKNDITSNGGLPLKPLASFNKRDNTHCYVNSVKDALTCNKDEEWTAVSLSNLKSSRTQLLAL